ncbi:hypothetical protein CVU37_11630 [candidate division BRC1 bacterium HGW-BRC1-1]|jgi:signal transduction histidine kinase|nr:MAG: hypothetical protein CVU37_11630 [candidate division BRC1 bacterium HGW-BRC1-1]
MTTPYFYPAAELGMTQSVFELRTSPITIGRHPSNFIPLLLDSISRFHARLEKRGTAWLLTDLQSSNGTFLNGERVTSPRTIVEGDVITLGRSDFTFSFLTPVERRALLDSPHAAPPRPHQHTSSVSLVGDDEQAAAVILSTRIQGEATPISMRGPEGQAPDLDALQQANERLLALYRLTEVIRDAPTVETMFQDVLDLVFESLPADRGVILTLDNMDDSLQARQVKFRNPGKQPDMGISRTIVQRVVDERVAILSRNTRMDSRFNSSESLMISDIRSAMCVPLVSKVRLMGVLFVDTREVEHAFNEDDLAFLSSVGNDLAVTLEMQMLQQANLHRERLAGIGQTIAGMAHNIKNILQLAKGGIELMDIALTRKNLDEIESYWPVVRRGIDRMQALTQEMLAYSRQTLPKLVEAAVNDVVRDTVALFHAEDSENEVKLNVELANDLPTRYIDPDGLQKALLNMLSNSVDAFDGREGNITISTSLEGHNVAVRVKDDGKGISRQKLAKIFQPFFTTKGSRGTGLGLSMTRRYIEDMGGSISVDSTEGEGTTFTIQLAPPSVLLQRETESPPADDPRTSV